MTEVVAPVVHPSAMCRAVPGFPGYHVNRSGAVFTTHKNRPGTRISQMTDRNGYRRVSLYRGCRGKFIKRRAHCLVLLSWVGPCPDGMECCHENGIRHDNRLSNLRWDTRGSNIKDRERHGTTARGERNGQSKLTASQVREIKCLVRMGASNESIASVFGIDPSNVCVIKKGRSWKHIK